jgi:hypothetical protein
MNRLVLTALIASTVVACGDNGNNANNNKIEITLFVAAPDTIDAGGMTQLVFAVAPPGTSANIDGVGDVTGRTQVMVMPSATTTYQLTATDGKTSANSSVTVTVRPPVPPPAKIPSIVLTVPDNANAGFPVSVGVTVKDQFGNVIPNYQGTVTFTNSDTGTGAVTPPPLTFAGTEGGVGTASATFITLGVQTLSASDAGTPVARGNATSTVHGLVYTAPPSGRIRLVANAAKSNAQIVQFDMVANERLEVSSFFGGGPGSFASGMNLPLDTTRADADTTLFATGDALVTGPVATPIAPIGIGRIGADHVLYTGVSRKRVAGPVFTQETEVKAGQVFYSVRLKLTQTATVGPVFDGAQPSTLFRASVRDQYGDDFVNQGDFGIGKLEVR